MSSTKFYPRKTLITAEWLNKVEDSISYGIVTSTQEILSLTPEAGAEVTLSNGLQSGVFVCTFGNFVTKCAIDFLHAVYVPFPTDVVPGTTGAWIRKDYKEKIYVGWWGLGMDSTIDDTVSVNAAIDFARQQSFTIKGSGRTTTRSLVFPQGGTIYCSDTVNFTFMPSCHVYWNGTTVVSSAGGKIAIDLGGAQAQHWYQARLVCSSTTGQIPVVGIRKSRVDDPGTVYDAGDYERNPSPYHKFYDCIFSGWASRAMEYNCGSEHNGKINCEIVNGYPSLTANDPTSSAFASVIDNYNDFNLGTLSTYAPLTTPAGYRGGTQHNDYSQGCRFVANGTNGTPCYFNGPRGMGIYNGFLLTSSGIGVVWGDGGYPPSANSSWEQLNVNNHLDCHCESAGSAGNVDLPIHSTFLFRAINTDININRFYWSDLRIHANVAVFTFVGTKNIYFDDVEIVPDSILNSNSNCYFFDPSFRLQVSGTGTLAVKPTPDIQKTLSFTTTAASSLISFQYKKHGLAVGDWLHIVDSATQGALLAVDGIILNGLYQVTAVIDANNITIDTLQTPSIGGITGDAANGSISAQLTNPKILDFDAGCSWWNGDINVGIFSELVRLPKGNITLTGQNLQYRIFKGDIRRVGNANSSGYLSAIGNQSYDAIPTPYNLKYTEVTGQTWQIALPSAVVPAGGSYVYDITTGIDDLATTDMVMVNAPFGVYTGYADIDISARCITANQVHLIYRNRNASSVTVPAATYTIQSIRPSVPIVLGSYPVNTGLPVISGTVNTWQTLTATVGTWTLSPTRYFKQWYRTTAGTTVPIPGETGVKYIITPADIGSTLSFSAAPPYSKPAFSADTAVVTSNVNVPGAVNSYSIGTVTSTSVQLLWSAPGTGLAVTDYIVQYRRSVDGSFTTFTDGVTTTPGATVTGLTADTTYVFRVYGINASGNGAYTDITQATLP